jgi:hypothetical protein
MIHCREAGSFPNAADSRLTANGRMIAALYLTKT